MRLLGVLCFLAFFTLICLAEAPTGQETVDARQELFQVSLEAADAKAGAVVGAPLRLKVVLHNAGDKPLFIHDWTERAHVIVLKMVTKGYPATGVR